MLQGELEDHRTLIIRNYTPLKFEDITITVKSDKNSVEDIEIGIIDSINAFLRYEVTIEELPVDLDLDSVSISFDGEGRNINKLKEITIPWKIIGFMAPGGSWVSVYPEHARMFSAIILNFAYLASQDYFKDEFPTLWLEKTPGEMVDWEVYYKQFTEKEHKLRLAVVKSVEGLNAGQNVGLNPRLLVQYARKHTFTYNGLLGTFWHEVNHSLGYGHSGSMTNPIKKVDDPDKHERSPTIALVNLFYEKLQERELPYDICADDVIEFEMAPSYPDSSTETQVEKILANNLKRGWTFDSFCQSN